MTELTTLDVIDLCEDEQVVYEAVVAHQPITPDDLAAIAGVEGSQLRLAMKRLQVKGLINEASRDAGEFVASPPDIALGALLLDREDQLKRARLEVDKLAAVHQRASSLLADKTSIVEVVSGREAVLRRFEQVQRAGRDEIRIIDRPPYVDTDPYGNVSIEEEMVGRGVGYRVIYDPRGLDSFHDLAGDVQASIEAGVDARVLPEAPLKLLLVDSKLAMIPLRIAADHIDSVVVVHPSAVFDALSMLFEQLWDRALPLIPPGRVPAGHTDPMAATDEDRRLLTLLTAGLPDESIAKHLKVSHRTMQRRLRVLLDRLGVQTRFQAALRAVSLGWLPAPPPRETPAEVNGDSDDRPHVAEPLLTSQAG